MKSKKLFLIPSDDPRLKQPCDFVEAGDDLSFMDEMERIVKKNKCCVGLAASQLGIMKRAIFIFVKDGKGTIRGKRMYNPRIVEQTPSEEFALERCLSFPGVEKVVSRPIEITVQYQVDTREGSIRIQRCEGFMARVICHEIDHTNGICRVGHTNGDMPVNEFMNRIEEVGLNKVGVLSSLASIIIARGSNE